MLITLVVRFKGYNQHMPLTNESIEFFAPYMEDFDVVLYQAMQKHDRLAIQMLDQIEKFIKLAELAEGLGRSVEQIQAFFYVSLLDTLYNLHDPNTNLRSKERIAAFFDEFLEDDEETFKYGLQRSLVDADCREKGCHLSRPDLIKLLFDLRCAFTHEGVSSELHYSINGFDSMCHITHQNGKISIYDMRMDFEEFRDVFIRMGLRCMRKKLASTT